MELTISYVNEILIFVVFAVSLNLLLGYAGQVSVAPAAFGAIGGYSVAYLSLNHGWSFLPAFIFGIVLAGVVGVFVGIPALRLTTEWLILLTLATQTIIVSLATTSSSFGGLYGLQNVVGLRFFGSSLNTPTGDLPLFAVVAVIVFLLCYRIGQSPYGRVLKSIREDDRASRSLGKNIFRYKLVVFGITSSMAGAAGALLVIQNTLASPQLFGFDQSTAIIVMVIFGGMGNLYGSVLGATILVLSDPFLQKVVKLGANTASLWRLTIYGLLLVIVMLVRPQGLIPEGASVVGWLRRRRPTAVAAPGGPVLASVAVPGSDAGNAAAMSRADTGNGDATSPDAATDAATLARIRAHQAAPAEEVDLATQRLAHRGEVVLQVRGLTKAFGGIHAAEDLDMDFRRGTITALVGPNGAGKTTVFNLLTGAIAPDRGQVLLNGRDVVGMTPNKVAGLGMVRSFQDVRVFPRLTALENVMLGVQGQAGERMGRIFFDPAGTARVERQTREKARQWLSFVGMDAMALVPAGALGFGQQKLVALARVLATEAEVVLLDEPASGIDQQWVDAMLDLIEQLRPQGRTVCIVEHNLAVVGRLADHTYFMELGRITAQGNFTELTNEPRLAEAYFGTA
jgi:branched-chain amino acid transport system permease protein